jgi:hypothetical protein
MDLPVEPRLRSHAVEFAPRVQAGTPLEYGIIVPISVPELGRGICTVRGVLG